MSNGFTGGYDFSINKNNNVNNIESSFTGMDPSEAINNIRRFGSRCIDAEISFDKCFRFLFDELYYIWCSPNAVEFSKKYNMQIGDFFINTSEKFGALRDNLVRAYNIVANANGYESYSEYNDGSEHHPFHLSGVDVGSGIIDKGVESFKSLVDRHPTNGTVGMNINLVKLVMSQFAVKANEVLANYESIPTNVAIYDPAGEQAQTISDAINETKMSIASFLENIITDINAYIETEQNSIMLAKQQVVQNMNGSSTTNA